MSAIYQPDIVDRRTTRRGARARAGRRRARRAHAAVQGAAAEALLRRARLRAVRPHHRAARVLPDARRAGDPARRRRRRSSPRRAPSSWSSSAPARPRRRACCSARWRAPASCAATSRSTSPSRSCARAPRRSSTSTRACACTASSATSSATSTGSRRRRPASRGSSRCSAARSATSRPAAAAACCARSRALLGPEDRLLLGTDLVKDPDVLEAAYDDAAGVTAEFNRNVLHVLNRELDADFHARRVRARRLLRPPPRVDRDAPARAAAPARCSSARSGCEVELAAGEEIRTEISAKFTPERLAEPTTPPPGCSSPAGTRTPTSASRCRSRRRSSDAASAVARGSARDAHRRHEL